MQQQGASVPKKQQQATAAEWAERFERQVEERAKKAADAQAKHRADKAAKGTAKCAFSSVQPKCNQKCACLDGNGCLCSVLCQEGPQGSSQLDLPNQPSPIFQLSIL